MHFLKKTFFYTHKRKTLSDQSIIRQTHLVHSYDDQGMLHQNCKEESKLKVKFGLSSDIGNISP